MPILSSGRRLGPYLVHDLVGQGGMAEVYRATHTVLNRDVALKVLNPTFNSDPTFPLRFLREAKVCARLRHPNIITVYDFDETGEIAYLAMELASGGTLGDQTPTLATLGAAIQALGPVLEAVGFANGHGVVHRDIKPENVLFSGDQQPLLTDFGLARIQSESLDIEDVGLILGTPYYMAPEQVLAEAVDARADVYALGILTYAVLAGRVPYDGSSFTAIVRQHLTAPPPSVRAVLPAVPARLDAAVVNATAKRREDRFPSAAAFLQELQAAAAEAPALPVGAAAAIPLTTSSPAPAMQGTVVQTAALNPHALFTADERDACPTCGAAVRPGIRFCTACGGRIPDLGARDQAAGGALTGAASGRRRRASSFTRGQWVTLGFASLAVVVINAIGLWLTLEGRRAGEDGFASSLLTYIYDHLPWFKSGMTLVALILAGMASYTMRVVVIDPRQRTPRTYRRLRQYHRLMGYAAAMVAFAIGLLTCIGIFGFDVSTTRRAVHSTIGSALLIVIAGKIAVVRFVPRYRRYLNLIGLVIVALYALTFASSAVPWVWQTLQEEAPVYRLLAPPR